MSGSVRRLTSTRKRRGQRAWRRREHVDALLAMGFVAAITGAGTHGAGAETGRYSPGSQWVGFGSASVWVRPDGSIRPEHPDTRCNGRNSAPPRSTGRSWPYERRAKLGVLGAERAPCINDAQCADFSPCTVDFCYEGTCAHDIAPAGAECRPSAGVCDPAELCDGVTVGCPVDGREPAGAECRAAIGTCDSTEICDGVSPSCPADVFQDAGTECRAPVGSCDLAETCDGVTTVCPADGVLVAGTVCRSAIGACDLAESCDGVSGTCPLDTRVPAGTECRASTGLCDPAETCTGVSGACPANAVAPLGTVCRASTGSCDPAEACDGISDTCPVDALEPNGNPCDDGQACAVGETCQSGICTGGTAPDCTGQSSSCVTATCDPQGSEGNCDVLSPVADGTICDDGTPCTDAVCSSGACTFNASTAVITVDISVEALANAVARDVTFVVTACAGAGDFSVVPVSFDSAGSGTALLTGMDGAATWIAASEGHTLRRLLPLIFTDCAAQVGFVGVNSLIAGDFQTAGVAQDNIVDITDFSVLASRFNVPIDPTASAGADATGDGLQASADFGAIQANFFLVGDGWDGCSLETDREPLVLALKPLEHTVAIPVLEPRTAMKASALQPGDRARVDLNVDGVVDMQDMHEFVARHGLSLHPDVMRRVRESALKRQDRPVRR